MSRPSNIRALYVMKASRNEFDRVLVWGDSAGFGESFVPEDCWALRFGKPHHFGFGARAITCPALMSISACQSRLTARRSEPSVCSDLWASDSMTNSARSSLIDNSVYFTQRRRTRTMASCSPMSARPFKALCEAG